MLAQPEELVALARWVDAEREHAASLELLRLHGEALTPLARALGVVLSACYPALSPLARSQPAALERIALEGWAEARSSALYRRAFAERSHGLPFGAALRRFAKEERARIALREALPHSLGGADVDVTAAELSALADATIELALGEAIDWATARFGRAFEADGVAARFVVIGMGKLGGQELNAGSDVDLMYFCGSDEGEVLSDDGDSVGMSLGEYWQRVAKRLTTTLEEPTDEGQVWRVDLRLRPEGSTGPLVLSQSAAERYYESFGRLWERAALLRARPVAGDLGLGEGLLAALAPFVWRRRIDPGIAKELVDLLRRARGEQCADPERDLKLGPGGIRAAEFFVQALQLIWGGKDPSLRGRTTIPALLALEQKGFSTQRETIELSDAYLALRRAEHGVQVQSGVQTHELPSEARALSSLARTLGFASADDLTASLDAHRERVERRLLSLVPRSSDERRWFQLLAALESADLERVLGELGAALASAEMVESYSHERQLAFAKSLLELSGHPDSVLGFRTREAFPGLADSFLEVLFEAADPAQAAGYLRLFFGRVRQVAVYVRLLFADAAALRRLIGVLGASKFVGEALGNNPELGDMILFSRDTITERAARDEVLACASQRARPDEDPDEAFVEALRVAKTRLVLSVALADLSGSLAPREVNRVLSAIADASLEAATRRALDTDQPEGLSVVAMGKLGGYEISYGSDLDVLFVFDPDKAPDPEDAVAYFTRKARKIIRYITTFHGAGPGYDLDTRLRPSGNQGLLVTSLEAFARHHGVGAAGASSRGAVWERMALLRARPAAGDREIGARALEIAQRAAFGEGLMVQAAAAEMRRIRERVEVEQSRERGTAIDLKFGRGALLDLEFVVQFLVVSHPEVMRDAPGLSDTQAALEALVERGVIAAREGQTLSDAYAFLRLLELRVRVMRGDAEHVLDKSSPELVSIARRMGLRDHPTMPARQRLIARYETVTRSVRAIFERTFARGD